MEQTNASERHCHVIFVAAFNDCVITHGTARLCDVLHTALLCALDIVTEREERVRTKTYAGHLIQPCAFLFSGENFRFYLEDLFPRAVCQNIHVFLSDIYVDGIVSVRAADTIHKLKIQYFRALAQEPVVSLLSGKSCTVYTGLLILESSRQDQLFNLFPGSGPGQCPWQLKFSGREPEENLS